jgi:hypothetical protein
MAIHVHSLVLSHRDMANVGAATRDWLRDVAKTGDGGASGVVVTLSLEIVLLCIAVMWRTRGMAAGE